jgi:ApaG protein
MSDSEKSLELPGLHVVLDRVEYHAGGPQVPSETPHVFIYHLTIHNHSEHRVRLLGRKWVLSDGHGNCRVTEGDKIVGQTPDLAPGASFSYNSFHLTAGAAVAEGSFHGVDDLGRRVFVRIAPIEMRVPSGGEGTQDGA